MQFLEHLVGFGSVDEVAPSVVYEFNMTAGSLGAVFVGYEAVDDPILGLGGVGSIDDNPIEGHRLFLLMVFSGIFYVVFEGDVTALLSSAVLYIDGVPYTTAPWVYSEENDVTLSVLIGVGIPTIVSGVTYNVKYQ